MNPDPSARTSSRGSTTVALIAVALAALAATPMSARAGEYVAAQCDPVNRGHADARLDRNNGGDYAFGKHCGEGARGNALQIRNISSAPPGRQGVISWAAPAGSRLVAVSGEARLRGDAGHGARVGLLDAAGRSAETLARGLDEAGGFQSFGGRLDVARAGLEATLGCRSAERCLRSTQARTWVRHLRLTIDDRSDPALALGGSLLAPVWLRGTAGLELSASDRGAGLRRIVTEFNGRPYAGLTETLGCALAGSSSIAKRLSPCPPDRVLAGTLDTRVAPLRNGVNHLRVCAADFGRPQNRHCVPRRLRIDNAAPDAHFVARRPHDPELVIAAVTDRHSGAAQVAISYRPAGGGEWRALETAFEGGLAAARVDSSAEPAGRYLFRIAVRDVAGNEATSALRADGSRQILRFPLREQVRLHARVADARLHYGEAGRLSGRLSDRRGRPLTEQRVRVHERFRPGSSPATRTRSINTDPQGRFGVRLAPGPSRKVVIGYPGSPRYLPATAPAEKLLVRSEARLRLLSKRVAAGRRAWFVGRIGQIGASIPAPGKVVELQVRASDDRRWRTVRQALHTNSRGRLRTSYSFDRFYSRPTRFQFRLKLTRESGWPYRAPAHSPTKTLTVTPR